MIKCLRVPLQFRKHNEVPKRGGAPRKREYVMLYVGCPKTNNLNLNVCKCFTINASQLYILTVHPVSTMDQIGL